MSSTVTHPTLSAQPVSTEELNAEQVAAWLVKHNDFFIGREKLLTSLELGHDCGDSESLLLYQLKALREELYQQQQKHEKLLNNARDNEVRLKRIEQLVIKLLEADNTEELVDFLQEELEESFALPHLAIWSHSYKGLLPKASEEQKQQQLALLANRPSANLQLNAEKATLLGLDDLQQGSAIICRLKHSEHLGLLVIAHPSNHHFRQQDTLFVEYLGSIVSSLLNRHQR